MAVVIPNGYAQVIYEIEREGDTDPYNVILGARIQEVPLLPDVADEFRAAFSLHLASQMNVAQTLTSITVLTDTETFTLATDIVGLVEAQDLPPNCAVLVAKNSAFRGRSRRGRNYWPGFIAEGSVNGVGVIDTDDLTGLQNAFDAWMADLDTVGNLQLVILHDETSPTTVPTPVTGLVVRPTIATQRRRLR